MLELIKTGPPDPMFDIKKAADRDTYSDKVDLGVGIYRSENGSYHEFDCVRRAKETLQSLRLDHDYELTVGNEEFLENGRKLLFGEGYAVKNQNIASVQTISGTGANHLGALLLSQSQTEIRPQVWIGYPAWGNYQPLFELVGFQVVHFDHYDTQRKSVHLNSYLRAVKSAPSGSIFVLQACCHNPTGADMTMDQWKVLAHEIKLAGHFPFFDIAYQGLGRGLDEDAFAIRHFAEEGLEMLVCQSFSKNFGLYGERVGALHVVCSNSKVASNVRDRLRSLIRWEFSSSPAFGSRLVNIVFRNMNETTGWQAELVRIRHRLQQNRSRLYRQLTSVLRTPGDWSHILRESGLFSYLSLDQDQCRSLVDKYHIYLPANGRINIAGLNESNVERVAQAIDLVVRGQGNDRNATSAEHPLSMSRL